jgi:hypothetical protein
VRLICSIIGCPWVEQTRRSATSFVPTGKKTACLDQVGALEGELATDASPFDLHSSNSASIRCSHSSWRQARDH